MRHGDPLVSRGGNIAGCFAKTGVVRCAVDNSGVIGNNFDFFQRCQQPNEATLTGPFVPQNSGVGRSADLINRAGSRNPDLGLPAELRPRGLNSPESDVRPSPSAPE